MLNIYIDRNMKKDYIKPAMIAVAAKTSNMFAVSLVVDNDKKDGVDGDAKGSMWDYYMNEEEE